MPAESESVLWRLRSPGQLLPWQTSSGYAPSQSSPLTFIRDSVNVNAASDCSLIGFVRLSHSLFKHSYTSSSLGPGVLSPMHPHTRMQRRPPFFLCSLRLVFPFVRSDEWAPSLQHWPASALFVFFFLVLSFYSSSLFVPSWALHVQKKLSRTANISNIHTLWALQWVCLRNYVRNFHWNLLAVTWWCVEIYCSLW